ncbi:hypothetical protein BCV69DRAFT_281095 [Microstroma glucosiphilum]|uniref:Uncharacterized protein n=1 Tax=Pseudomicrostroma glucosiphilum TaxID=1684307 RepID=A0A316UG22_9BASI|nr:hypothetical protein BCV69DRAFT_281095 [Pseudomicrostroma glucosiphilum]PWN22095.1 hypothetical protein BCV69DRAFT_281095 [Pseudomicrostroma glucosiphilum]
MKEPHFSYNEVGASKDILISGVEQKGQEQRAITWILGIVCNDFAPFVVRSRRLRMLLRSLRHIFPTAKIASGSNHRICLEVIVAMAEALPPDTRVFVFARFANVIGRTEAVHLDEEVFNVPYNLAAGIKFVGVCAEASPDSVGPHSSGAYCRSSISALATVTLSEGNPELFFDATRWRKTALTNTFLHITRGERLSTLKNLTWKQNLILGTSAASAAAEATTFKLFGSGYLTMGWHTVSKSSQCLIGVSPAMVLLSLPGAVSLGALGYDRLTSDHVCLLNGSSDSNRPVKLSKKLLDELKQYAHTYFLTFSDSFGPVQGLSAPIA